MDVADEIKKDSASMQNWIAQAITFLQAFDFVKDFGIDPEFPNWREPQARQAIHRKNGILSLALDKYAREKGLNTSECSVGQIIFADNNEKKSQNIMITICPQSENNEGSISCDDITPEHSKGKNFVSLTGKAHYRLTPVEETTRTTDSTHSFVLSAIETNEQLCDKAKELKKFRSITSFVLQEYLDQKAGMNKFGSPKVIFSH